MGESRLLESAEFVEQRRRFAWVAAVFAVVFLSVSIAVVASTTGEGTLGPLPSAAAFDVDPEAEADEFIALDGQIIERPLFGRYGGIDVAVIGAKAVPTNGTGRPIIMVDVEVHNRLDVQVRVPRTLFSVVNQLGDSTMAHRFNHTATSKRMVIEAGETMAASIEVRLALKAPTDLDRYTLEVSEPGQLPLTLPLSADDGADDNGSVAAEADSLKAKADRATAEALTANGATATTGSATIANDFRGYRTTIDHHLLVVTVDLVDGNGTALSNIGRSDWWWAEADGQEHRAVAVQSQTVSASTERLLVVFELPTSATSVAVTGGDSDSAKQPLANVVIG